MEASVDAARKLTGGDRARSAAEALATVPRPLRMEVLLHVHTDMVRTPPCETRRLPRQGGQMECRRQRRRRLRVPLRRLPQRIALAGSECVTLYGSHHDVNGFPSGQPRRMALSKWRAPLKVCLQR